MSLSLSIFLVFVSYYTPYVVRVEAEPSGPVGCERSGTVKVTCCQDHIINCSPTNPAGTLVTYCTDCDILSTELGYTNCGERYIPGFEKDPNPPTQSPFEKQIPPGVIEQSQPLTQQDSNGSDENNTSQHSPKEQLSSSDNSIKGNLVDDVQNNDNNAESENNNNENENNDNEADSDGND